MPDLSKMKTLIKKLGVMKEGQLSVSNALNIMPIETVRTACDVAHKFFSLAAVYKNNTGNSIDFPTVMQVILKKDCSAEGLVEIAKMFGGDEEVTKKIEELLQELILVEEGVLAFLVLCEMMAGVLCKGPSSLSVKCRKLAIDELLDIRRRRGFLSEWLSAFGVSAEDIAKIPNEIIYSFGLLTRASIVDSIIEEYHHVLSQGVVKHLKEVKAKTVPAHEVKACGSPSHKDGDGSWTLEKEAKYQESLMCAKAKEHSATRGSGRARGGGRRG